MKRKALVAAIAGILSAPAVAAIDDAGMKYTSAAEGFYGSIRANLRIEDDKDANLANDLESSRLGVQGSVDLGGGLEATYRYEWDIENEPDFASLRLRQIGMTGDFGTLNFGQQWNVDYDYVFVGTDVANSGGGNFAEAFRWGSSARYDSNDLNGFKFSAQVQMDGSESDDDDDVDMYAVGASYSTAGFTVSGTYIGEGDKAHSASDAVTAAWDAVVNPRETNGATRTALVDAIDTAQTAIDDDTATTSAELLALENAERALAEHDTGLTLVEDGDSADNTIGIGLGYGQDNWQMNYFYKQSDVSGISVVCYDDDTDLADDTACSADGTAGSANEAKIGTVDNDGEETAHSLAGQVSFDKLTFRGIYEMQELDVGLATFDTSIFIGEVAYSLGSKSRVWVGFKNTDDDAADDEVTQFNLGYRVDF